MEGLDLIRCRALVSKVQRAVFADKRPLAFRERGLEIVIKIAPFVSRRFYHRLRGTRLPLKFR